MVLWHGLLHITSSISFMEVVLSFAGAIMALSDVNFATGRAFELYIKNQCGTPINPSTTSLLDKFFLVVSFLNLGSL